MVEDLVLCSLFMCIFTRSGVRAIVCMMNITHIQIRFIIRAQAIYSDVWQRYHMWIHTIYKDVFWTVSKIWLTQQIIILIRPCMPVRGVFVVKAHIAENAISTDPKIATAFH